MQFYFRNALLFILVMTTTPAMIIADTERVLSNVVEPEPLKQIDGVEWFEVPSKLLSHFRGRDVTLRAGFVLPQSYSVTKKYPTIYEVPGFGDDHRGAIRIRPRDGNEVSDATLLSKSSFRIVLDPEGPNGHSLFADSANNGPRGQALTEELIPALEAKYPLIAEASARLLRGHSSGGWSTLWLATRYPAVFGATWSSAPDPVDFRRFQKVDIYGQRNFYTDSKGADLPSLRKGDVVEMTIRQESRGEDMLGPDNTSAQQWDSWFAAFGPKNSNGNPAALFDAVTGQILACFTQQSLSETRVFASLRETRLRILPMYLCVRRLFTSSLIRNRGSCWSE